MDTTIKQLRNNEWHVVPNATFKGMTPHDVLMSFADTDTVCEIKTTQGLCYWCGKEKYCVSMRAKGHIAMTCQDAAQLYPDNNKLLEACIDVFGERQEVRELREEREAIMEAARVTASVVKEVCDKAYGTQAELNLS